MRIQIVPNPTSQSHQRTALKMTIRMTMIAMLGGLVAAVLGCSDRSTAISVDTDGQAESTRISSPKGSILAATRTDVPISAQGRLQPGNGIIRITALPGDLVESVLVEPGQSVESGRPLLTLQSEHLRRLDLESAELKLKEAEATIESKRIDAESTVRTAELRLAAAQRQLVHAREQSEIVQSGQHQLDIISRQIATLEKLRDDSLTRAAIGTLDLESKRSELGKAEAALNQSKLARTQAIQLAELQIEQEHLVLASAKSGRQLVDASTTIATLTKQLNVLRLQLEQSIVKAPINGTIISVNTEAGERTAQMPLVEIADLESMVCIAEVHESDVGRVSIGDTATIASAAIPRTLEGKVARIDRSVGAAQLRFPNPLSRSDFRSVPVWILIDNADTSLASARLQLQVDVTITTANR